MKKIFSLFLCCFIPALQAQTTFSLTDYAGHGYTSALGFETASLRIAQLHTWRQLQLMMRQVAYANAILLTIGWPGRADMGDNATLRFVSEVKATGKPDINTLKNNPDRYWDEVKNFKPEKLTFSNQWQPMVKGQIGGVCLKTDNKDCFENLRLQTDDPFTVKASVGDEVKEIDVLSIFNDFYGTGGRFDTILYQNTDALKGFDNNSLDITKNAEYEPMSPYTRFFDTQAYTGQTIFEQQKKIAGELQLQSFGEADAKIDDIDNMRLINKFASSSHGLSSVLQTVMESNMRKFQPRMIINLINQSEGLRELIQLSSHVALYQQNLIDTMAINQALGSLNMYAMEFAPTGGDEFNIPAKTPEEQTKLDNQRNELQSFDETIQGEEFFHSSFTRAGGA